MQIEKSNDIIDKKTIQAWFENLQDDICHTIAGVDGQSAFIEDKWDRAEGGGGKTRLLQNGKILEKAGVAFSAVFGHLPEKAAQSMVQSGSNARDLRFFATGVSIVMHPQNPMVPIIHMNVRYFETTLPNGDIHNHWFGGGIDLSPHYVDEDDARFFHQALKKACDKHDLSYYPTFKKWADDYFYIHHRQETRGVGGIFFDQLREDILHTKEQRFDFVKEIGNAFAPVYSHLMKKNAALPFGEHEKKWQSLRRGRYVEFNLVLDRGTKFGLETNGRTESILMSMPPMAQWEYNYLPAKGTPEEKTLSLLKKDIDWAGKAIS